MLSVRRVSNNVSVEDEDQIASVISVGKNVSMKTEGKKWQFNKSRIKCAVYREN